MKLTIHRGTHEVGGNCIEIESAHARIILDVGMPLFRADREPLDTGMLRRKSVEELQQLEILPQVRGLFDHGPPPDGILLSHAHLDHTGLLGHCRNEIPIYTSRGTSKMMLAGKLFANQVELPRERFRELKAGIPTNIKDITITAFPVDHSIFGCLAFLITAGQKTILYTGDLRLHGRKPGMHRSLIEAVQDRAIDVLLMEGTHFGLPDGHTATEYELEDEIVDHISSSPGLVLASFSPQHVDRLIAFIRAAIKTGRQFVADEYTAFIQYLISTDTPLPSPIVPGPTRVYFPQVFQNSAARKGLTHLLKKFQSNRIELTEIQNHPEKFLMVFRGTMLPMDFQGVLPPKTNCLYSRWAGYLDKPDWIPTKSAIEAAGGNLIPVHTSGHMLSRDIVTFVKSISAKVVVPIHTFEPEKFREHFTSVRVLKDGETYEILA
ncbi:MBL fold metallo-hydrolase [Planctomicrobium piriforme]|uniref:Ribonuclease J n=1 Tax=Planctomicrobium piriforme TaxID=1576369 RepID=A0A1I3SMA3_9PLAN|nr:MBL fold metallo-hydrolase [Planctomicrobium piriforme]SFJ58517.1 ribonuclease J [Planctomicrobium piriforme]